MENRRCFFDKLKFSDSDRKHSSALGGPGRTHRHHLCSSCSATGAVPHCWATNFVDFQTKKPLAVDIIDFRNQKQLCDHCNFNKHANSVDAIYRYNKIQTINHTLTHSLTGEGASKNQTSEEPTVVLAGPAEHFKQARRNPNQNSSNGWEGEQISKNPAIEQRSTFTLKTWFPHIGSFNIIYWFLWYNILVVQNTFYSRPELFRSCWKPVRRLRAWEK